MELYQLRSFLTIGQVNNLTKAAEKLNISKSALSSQIKSLEEELGIVLFERNPRGMVLTVQGNKLFNQAKQILYESDKFLQKAKNLKQNINGTLKLGLNADSGFLKTYLLNKQFEKQLPGVEIVFLNSDTLQTPEMLRKKEIDIAFLYNHVREKEISYITLFPLDIVIVIPAKFLKNSKSPDWDELCTFPWIWAYEDCLYPCHVILQNQFDIRSLTPKKITYAVGESIVSELVKSGQGVGIMRVDEADSLIKKHNVIVWDKYKIEMWINIAFLTSRKDEMFICEGCRTIYEFWTDKKDW